MEILVITWNYPPRRGGIENLIGNLCGSLRSKHSVVVVTSYAKSRHSEKDTFRARLPGLFPFAVYAVWRGALLLLGNSEIRVILGASATVTPLVLILARLFGRRAIIQVHGLDVLYQSFLYQQLCVRWLKSCDCVIANSSHTAELAELKGVTRDRISAIPPGVDPDRFSMPTDVDATKRSWNIEGRKIILFVGRLARRKGVKEFVENSLGQIVQEIPEACFLIVGENPMESLTYHDDVADEIHQTIAERELSDHVRWLGAVSNEELVNLYALCDVLVLPVLEMNTDVEGFGIVALEAAAAGKPVVATRAGGVPDAVEDGKSGILVEPGDYEGFSEAVLSLLRGREVASTMGEHGRRRVASDFAWSRVVARYDDEFRRLAECKP